MVLRSRAPRRARIEIIPMIDVVFFLLVFFMMASLAMTVYQGLPVNLPEAASGQRNAAETASITLSRDGGSFLNSEPVTVAMLGARIRPLLAKNRELAVIINADREVTHARVVDVLDELRQTGVGKIAIAVAPEGRARDDRHALRLGGDRVPRDPRGRPRGRGGARPRPRRHDPSADPGPDRGREVPEEKAGTAAPAEARTPAGGPEAGTPGRGSRARSHPALEAHRGHGGARHPGSRPGCRRTSPRTRC